MLLVIELRERDVEVALYTRVNGIMRPVDRKAFTYRRVLLNGDEVVIEQEEKVITLMPIGDKLIMSWYYVL